MFGISNTLVAGIYIEKQTRKLPIITFIGAGVNVAANYVLIPPMGIMGAALATLLSYGIMAIVLYFIVRKIYPVEYEWERIAKISIASAVVFLLYHFVKLPAFEFGWKCGLLALFAALMYAMKFFDASEISRLTRLFSKPHNEG